MFKCTGNVDSLKVLNEFIKSKEVFKDADKILILKYIVLQTGL